MNISITRNCLQCVERVSERLRSCGIKEEVGDIIRQQFEQLVKDQFLSRVESETPGAELPSLPNTEDKEKPESERVTSSIATSTPFFLTVYLLTDFLLLFYLCFILSFVLCLTQLKKPKGKERRGSRKMWIKGANQRPRKKRGKESLGIKVQYIVSRSGSWVSGGIRSISRCVHSFIHSFIHSFYFVNHILHL